MKAMKPWDQGQAMDQVRKYCAWQERCRSEIISKLRRLGCPTGEEQPLLATLEREGFWDEARFASAYATGKFSQKAWGKARIRAALRGKQVQDTLIEQALQGIDPEAYGQRLEALARKWLRKGDPRDWETAQKLRHFLQGKGYEWEAVDHALQRLEQET